MEPASQQQAGPDRPIGHDQARQRFITLSPHRTAPRRLGSAPEIAIGAAFRFGPPQYSVRQRRQRPSSCDKQGAFSDGELSVMLRNTTIGRPSQHDASQEHAAQYCSSGMAPLGPRLLGSVFRAPTLTPNPGQRIAIWLASISAAGRLGDPSNHEKFASAVLPL
jgi:hypothetical protein